uniref:Uncharacterized protein n=1 Tax=Chromera velia CCMP2878 TaxID=1169474 RepID=A0A0G4GW96_9ALVE|eukprot:Cvel_5297.t1-p1 / transcript=Cvel_5297.t1 / gene=Cvel_5297 / organism=Chromera_velia_CCMP2878 / gene_product=Phosphatidylinositol-glycan-specific phospholipase, putative / transcript_product=Phosphatidylinositol-glycan-specific phospholipase, putative / location=Cvel_scaffold245:41771-44203(-) / protein_length=811 / sequence_SO=supercontig / SO=protein_coding / is_pseudo=false
MEQHVETLQDTVRNNARTVRTTVHGFRGLGDEDDSPSSPDESEVAEPTHAEGMTQQQNFEGGEGAAPPHKKQEETGKQEKKEEQKPSQQKQEKKEEPTSHQPQSGGDVEEACAPRPKEEMRLPLFSPGREVVCYLCMTVFLPAVVLAIGIAIQTLNQGADRYLRLSTRLSWSGLADGDEMGTQLCSVFREQLRPGSCSSSMTPLSSSSSRRLVEGIGGGQFETINRREGARRRRASTRFDGSAEFDITLGYTSVGGLSSATSEAESLASGVQSSSNFTETSLGSSIYNTLKNTLNIQVSDFVVAQVKAAGSRSSRFGDSFFVSSSESATTTTTTTTTTSTARVITRDMSTWASIFSGTSSSTLYGYSLWTGDINGDKVADLLIGGYSSRFFVVFGSAAFEDGSYTLDLDNLSASGKGFYIDGPSGSTMGYRCVSSADLDGDGIKDLIIGSGEISLSAQIYIFFGRESWSSSYSYTQADVRLNRVNTLSPFDPPSCSSMACDVDGDKRDDLIVGDPDVERVSVLYGQPADDWKAQTGATFTSFGNAALHFYVNDGTHKLGRYMGCEDLDGDLLGDLIMMDPLSTSIGNVVLVTGMGNRPTATDISPWDTNVAITLGVSSVKVMESSSAWGWADGSVFPAGDVNGDGQFDVFLTSPAYTQSQTDGGVVHILYGKEGGLSDLADAPSSTAISATSFSPLSRLVGDPVVASQKLGHSAGGIMDLNGDGVNDVAVCQPGVRAGSCLIVYSSALKNAGLKNLDTYGGEKFYNDKGSSSAQLGFQFAVADVTGDGQADIVITAPTFDGGTQGRIFVFA